MIKNFIVLGVKTNNIDEVTNDLEELLQIKFTIHESSYWGIYNLAKISKSSDIKLGYNYVDEDWREEEHKDCPLLVELNNLQQSEETMNVICRKLPYIIPLTITVIEPNISSRKYKFIDGEAKLVYEHFFR
ncbi:hypothetical protein [Metabacillus niabensis]|uniref:Uncharacterized protein n=1 Tax=Metabacillus niabensis TaxID=324854 RepID=A0ABT9Z4Y5_9BACI|nr:hypothetical protein [Metabacillus niabensis]MDQ0227321.1 hypothetical protein [Metabacillus niabensis]